MLKFFTASFLILCVLTVSIAEAKGGRGGGGARGGGARASSSRSSSATVTKTSAKPAEHPRDSKGRFASKDSTNTTTVTREDPAPGASGTGMAQTIVGSMVGAAAGVAVGNAITDVIRGATDDDESCITHEDKLTDEEKEVM